MASIFWPTNSYNDLGHIFVAKLPIGDDAFKVEDVDVFISKETRELVLIAKQKPRIKVDERDSGKNLVIASDFSELY